MTSRTAATDTCTQELESLMDEINNEVEYVREGNMESSSCYSAEGEMVGSTGKLWDRAGLAQTDFKKVYDRRRLTLNLEGLREHSEFNGTTQN